MNLIDKIQRDIDEIAEWGYCNYSETFKTLIEARKEIEKLREELMISNNSILAIKMINNKLREDINGQ